MIGHWYTNEIAVADRHARFMAEAEADRDAGTAEVAARRPSLRARLLQRARRRPAPTPVAVPTPGAAPVTPATS